MKKCFILCTVILFVLLGISMMILFNSDYYYAKKLVKAIEAEDIAAIEHILETKPSCVNTYPQILLERIFNTLCENRGTTYPLLTACNTGNIEIIKLLVEAGADVNCNDGRTALSLIYFQKKDNWYPISVYLIENGMSSDYVADSGGESFFFYNIVLARPEAALPEYTPESEEEVQAAFYHAVEHCDHSKVNWVWILQASVSNNRTGIVQFLLDEGYCDVNDTSRDMSALMFAARDSTLEMVQLLLDKGADKSYVDSDGMTAYDYAAKEQKAEIMELLAD